MFCVHVCNKLWLEYVLLRKSFLTYIKTIKTTKRWMSCDDSKKLTQWWKNSGKNIDKEKGLSGLYIVKHTLSA